MGRRRGKGDSLAVVFLHQLPWWVSLLAAGIVYVLATAAHRRIESVRIRARSRCARGHDRYWHVRYSLRSCSLIAVAPSSTRAFFHRLDPIIARRELEAFVADPSRRRAYLVLDNGGGRVEDGVDAFLSKNGHPVQHKYFTVRQNDCKRIAEVVLVHHRRSLPSRNASRRRAIE